MSISTGGNGEDLGVDDGALVLEKMPGRGGEKHLSVRVGAYKTSFSRRGENHTDVGGSQPSASVRTRFPRLLFKRCKDPEDHGERGMGNEAIESNAEDPFRGRRQSKYGVEGTGTRGQERTCGRTDNSEADAEEGVHYVVRGEG